MNSTSWTMWLSYNFRSFGRKVSASAELYGSTGAELSSLQEIKEDERVTLKVGHYLRI